MSHPIAGPSGNLGSSMATTRWQRVSAREPSAKEYRHPAQKDCDRVLYASAFRRLAGVTQVMDVSERQLFHNRLTHSMKVTQIGRRLAGLLEWKYSEQQDALDEAGGLNADVVEAACLAHDLGHPPFGHIGEAQLQASIKSWNEKRPEALPLDDFEGNAQTFRIVNKLSIRTSRNNDLESLDLTRATLRAILKYPWLSDSPQKDANKGKFGAYLSERSEFDFAMAGTSRPDRTLEADVMDWADDVTYAVHDFEDFVRAGMIPLPVLRSDLEAEKKLQGALIARISRRLARFEDDQVNEAFHILRKTYFPGPYDGMANSRGELHDMAGALFTEYVDTAEVRNGHLYIRPDREAQVNVLKQLTWCYVIDRPGLATRQRGQMRVIDELFTCLMIWVAEARQSPREKLRLPLHLRSLWELAKDDAGMQAWARDDQTLIEARSVVDYIASLTEQQALDLHARLMGYSATSALEGWLTG